jgi:hypothetical protein
MTTIQSQIVRADANSGITDRNNCTVCALSNVSGISYHEAHLITHAAGRKMRKGFKTVVLMKHIQENQDNYRLVFKEIMNQDKTTTPGVWVSRFAKKGMTIAKFIQQNPTGRFYVRRSGHAFAIINGVVHDHLTNKPLQRITHAWQFLGQC